MSNKLLEMETFVRVVEAGTISAAPGSNILGIIKELQDRLEKGQTTSLSAP